MKEKLQEYALIAEIFSGLAVLITLAILILQIHDNTDAVRISAFQDIVDSLNDWRQDVTSNPVKAALFADYALNSKVPEAGSTDFLVLQMTLETVYSDWETAYFAHESGIISDPQWIRIDRNICIAKQQLLWNDTIKSNIFLPLTDEFIEFMAQQTCG